MNARRNDLADSFILEVNLYGFSSKRTDGGLGVLEEVDGGVPVVLVVHGAEPGIGCYLPGDVFDMAGLDIQLTLNNFGRAERTHCGASPSTVARKYTPDSRRKSLTLSMLS